MSVLRSRRALRAVCVAATVLSIALIVLAWRDRAEPYVAGEQTEGLVNTLARSAPSDRPRVEFSDVTASTGIRFQHFPFERTNRLPEDMGSGVALADVDGDGWTDVFLVNFAHSLADESRQDPSAGARSTLFLNKRDGSFEDVGRERGLDLEVLGLGAGFLDVDSDGDLDLLVSCFGGLVLMENDGSGHFADVTQRAGLAGRAGFWTGLAFGDYDKDGAIDIYVCGYVRYSDAAGARDALASQYGAEIPVRINPSAFEPEVNLLFHNQGDGTFEELASAAGVANPEGRSLGATFADLSGDGWPDLYVANDVSDNAYFVNHRDGTFSNEAAHALVADYRGAMGLAIGDFDGDEDLDFVVTHWIGQESALYVNYSKPGTTAGDPGQPLFMDSADRFGLGSTTLRDVGWATRFFDFDNDGTLDLFLVNGSTLPDRRNRSELAPQTSQLFWNAGGKRGFFEVGAQACDFFATPHVGRGGASFDYDLDGDEDLLITVHGDAPHLLRNEGGDLGNCLRLRLRQPTGNRFALGARVRVEVAGRVLFDELETQGSYLSQHAVGEVSFGLADAAAIERLEVTWPDGTREEQRGILAGTLVEWARGSPLRIEMLPGRRAMLARGPAQVEQRKRFFDLVQRANAERLAGSTEAAIASYAEALELWPAHADCMYYLAHCLAEAGRDDESLAAFEELVVHHPEQSRGWMEVGEAHLYREPCSPADLARAESAFRRCRAINGEESQPLVRLGLVALLRGDLDAADRRLAEAEVLNATSIEARYFRAKIAWLRNEPVQAKLMLDRCRALASQKGSVATAILHEGGTRTGTALLPPGALRGQGTLRRWQSLLERTGDPAEEFGDPTAR